MFNKTNLIIIIAVFQLSFFGWMFREIKIVGDLLFFSLLFYVFVKYSVYLKEQNDNIFKLPRFARIAVIIFFFYVIFQFIYSSVLWGQPLLVLQEGRRWLIASIYFYLLVSLYPVIFESKTIIMSLVVFLFVVFISILLLSKGFSLPSAESTLQEQGGIWLFKPFIPGTIIFYLLFIYNVFKFFDKQISFRQNIYKIVTSLVLLFLCIKFVPFRGWVISSIVGIFISIFIYLLKQFSFKRFLKWSSITFLLFVALLMLNIAPRTVGWLSSAFTDIQNLQGDYLVRYMQDVSKLEILRSKEIYLINGIGFIHKSSEAAKEIGYSSETNDTGWVEILLTGGIVGSLLFLLLYTSILLYFLKLYLILENVMLLVLLSTWIMSGLLLISSNLIFWDFGFVPISLISIAILSKVFNDYEKSNVNWRATPTE